MSLASGCCSAALPCNHQKASPDTLCDACKAVRAEALAQRFHETYERLAPSFAYETRKASAKPWAEVPDNNKRLMIAVCSEILASLYATCPRCNGAGKVPMVRAIDAGPADDGIQDCIDCNGTGFAPNSASSS